MEKQLIKFSFISAAGTFIYVALVAWLMSNASHLFGTANDIWSGMLFLMLFVFSATVVGLIVLSKPAFMFISGDKIDAIKLVVYTVSWLAVMIILILSLKMLKII